MQAKVFLSEVKHQNGKEDWHHHIQKLAEAVELDRIVQDKDIVAIKLHFGEKGNRTHIQPRHIKPLVKIVKGRGASPFLADTTVLYKSARSDAVSYLRLVHEHGFTIDKVGAPVIIVDGVIGDSELDVEINGKIFDQVSIASEILKANSVLVVTHVTGHIAMGLGGTIKNLGMGLSSRKGKMRQHSAMKPKIIRSKCTACGLCIEWCPVDAITMVEGAALIDSTRCIGCGECLTVCRFDSVEYNWGVESTELQRKTAEHALGVVINRREKFVYFSYLINITRDCDCFGTKMKPVIADIGVLASTDPVAIDRAAIDLIAEKAGKPFRELFYPNLDETVQLEHAQEIGLGSMDYDLIRI